MALDAAGDDARHRCTSTARGGTLEAALTIIDTIDLLGVPVRARCVGRAEGVAVGIVAVAHHRSATPHAALPARAARRRVRRSAPPTSRRNAREHQRQVESFVDRLASATGRPFEHVEADLERGRWLDADEALAYGLIDEIERPEPRRSRATDPASASRE